MILENLKNIGRKTIRVVLSLGIIGGFFHFGNTTVYAIEESRNGVRNENLELTLIPRGNPKKSQAQERRRLAHTSFESTGLFLYSGEEITVIVEGTPENLELRVGQWGGYTDVPYIANGSQSYAFQEGVFKLQAGVNTFKRDFSGGMVYLANYSESKTEKVTIQGGVHVPYYIQGKTSVEDFKQQLNTYIDVPFMEFVNDEALATIRIERARDIFEKDNQVDVFMDTLSRAVKTQDEVAGLSKDYGGKANIQDQRLHLYNPSWGAGMFFATDYFMGIHSATTSDRTIFSNPAHITSWGLLHEAGHTYQTPYFMWKNMGEVTVNIFSDYSVQHWTPDASSTYDAKNEGSNTRRRDVRRYFDKLATDPTWTFDREANENPSYHFSLLGMFLTLSRVFGDDFYPILHQEYRSLKESELPRDDEAEKQMFVLLTSKVAQRDLSAFYENWRFTLTDDTKEKLAALKLPPLEKEIWKDILATEAEEQAGTYRILGHVGPYTVPMVNKEMSVPTIPFESLKHLELDATSLYSFPVASTVTMDKTETILDDALDFNNPGVKIRVRNENNVSNVLDVPVDVTPGDSIVMSGQNGRYAIFGYDAQTKQLVAQGNSNRIFQNVPNTIFPHIKVYNQSLTSIKKEVIGYGSTVGKNFADELNGYGVDIGDVVEVYHYEASRRISRYENNELLPTVGNRYYYQITEDGWREVTLDVQEIQAQAVTAFTGDQGVIEVQTLPDNAVNATTYQYYSENPEIITVDETGKWKALNEGTTKIRIDATVPLGIDNQGQVQTKTLTTEINAQITKKIITITADKQINYPIKTAKNEQQFFADIHASVTEGAIISSDFETAVDFETAGVYPVTLMAKDTVGNEALPVSVTVIVTDGEYTVLDNATNEFIRAYSVEVSLLELSQMNFVEKAKAKAWDVQTGEMLPVQMVSEKPTTIGTHELVFATPNGTKIKVFAHVLPLEMQLLFKQQEVSYAKNVVPTDEELKETLGVEVIMKQNKLKKQANNKLQNIDIIFDRTGIDYTKAGRYELSVSARHTLSGSIVTQNVAYIVKNDSVLPNGQGDGYNLSNKAENNMIHKLVQTGEKLENYILLAMSLFGGAITLFILTRRINK